MKPFGVQPTPMSDPVDFTWWTEPVSEVAVMRRDRVRFTGRYVVVLAMLACPPDATAQLAPRVAGGDSITELRIDPLLLVTVKELRNVIRALGEEIYPGWRAESIPMLLYRPRVQELLLGARRAPPGFRPFAGQAVLPGETIWARDDSTVMDIDDQNTTMLLDSARVLVVADRYSRERNQLTGALDMRPDRRARWLEEWSFIQSAYDELTLMLHEAFHVHQERLAPGKGANESAILRYPLLSATNNALVALEGLLLRDALLAKDAADRRARATEFVAVRAERRAGLDSAAAAYEDGVEYHEGAAKYVEYRFLQLGGRVTPVTEMSFNTGFHGYRGVLPRILAARADDLARIAANTDDRFGNRFGAGPLRFRLYGTGGAQGILLDEVLPAWKRRIFAPGVTFTGLLMEALPLSAAERRELIAGVQARYGYDTLYAGRVAFEAEGRRRIAAKVDAILRDTGTVVTIRYEVASAPLRMAYTPFGVTAVSESVAIYDLVPVGIRFPNGVVLRMKTVRPVLLDRAEGTATFAVATPPQRFQAAAGAGLDLDDFTLTSSPLTTVSVAGRRVTIVLR